MLYDKPPFNTAAVLPVPKSPAEWLQDLVELQLPYLWNVAQCCWLQELKLAAMQHEEAAQRAALGRCTKLHNFPPELLQVRFRWEP